ncbi:MAG: hypothetical protein DMG06_21080 [Acidobacteria bacterium]|nr:MAG: hypothetical protein DMG06_21080 [Acidobacteriota bacterium]
MSYSPKEAFGIYRLQGMGRWLSGCPRVAAGPQPLGCISNPLRGKRRFVDKSRGFQTNLLRSANQNKSQEIKKCLELHLISTARLNKRPNRA